MLPNPSASLLSDNQPLKQGNVITWDIMRQGVVSNNIPNNGLGIEEKTEIEYYDRLTKTAQRIAEMINLHQDTDLDLFLLQNCPAEPKARKYFHDKLRAQLENTGWKIAPKSTYAGPNTERYAVRGEQYANLTLYRETDLKNQPRLTYNAAATDTLNQDYQTQADNEQYGRSLPHVFTDPRGNKVLVVNANHTGKKLDAQNKPTATDADHLEDIVYFRMAALDNSLRLVIGGNFNTELDASTLEPVSSRRNDGVAIHFKQNQGKHNWDVTHKRPGEETCTNAIIRLKNVNLTDTLNSENNAPTLLLKNFNLTQDMDSKEVSKHKYKVDDFKKMLEASDIHLASMEAKENLEAWDKKVIKRDQADDDFDYVVVEPVDEKLLSEEKSTFYLKLLLRYIKTKLADGGLATGIGDIHFLIPVKVGDEVKYFVDLNCADRHWGILHTGDAPITKFKLGEGQPYLEGSEDEFFKKKDFVEKLKNLYGKIEINVYDTSSEHVLDTRIKKELETVLQKTFPARPDSSPLGNRTDVTIKKAEHFIVQTDGTTKQVNGREVDNPGNGKAVLLADGINNLIKHNDALNGKVFSNDANDAADRERRKKHIDDLQKTQCAVAGVGAKEIPKPTIDKDKQKKSFEANKSKGELRARSSDINQAKEQFKKLGYPIIPEAQDKTTKWFKHIGDKKIHLFSEDIKGNLTSAHSSQEALRMMALRAALRGDSEITINASSPERYVTLKGYIIEAFKAQGKKLGEDYYFNEDQSTYGAKGPATVGSQRGASQGEESAQPDLSKFLPQMGKN